MKKVISFSLYGKEYYRECAKLVLFDMKMKKIFRDWKVRIYLEDRLRSRDFLLYLDKYNVEVINMPRCNDARGMFWRFFPAFDSDVDVMISRDIDTYLLKRDYIATEEFIKSNYRIQSMNEYFASDYNDFRVTLLHGGCWGCKCNTISNLEKSTMEYLKNNKKINYWDDEDFLHDHVFLGNESDTVIYTKKGRKLPERFNHIKQRYIPEVYHGRIEKVGILGTKIEL